MDPVLTSSLSKPKQQHNSRTVSTNSANIRSRRWHIQMPNHWTAETVLLRHDRLGIFTSTPGSSDSHTGERSDVRCLLYQNGHQTGLSSSVDCCNWPSRSTRLQSSPSPGKNMRPLSQKCKKHLKNRSFSINASLCFSCHIWIIWTTNNPQLCLSWATRD